MQSSTIADRSLHDARGGAIDVVPLRGLLVRLVATWQPEQVWLFGSRARGEAESGSDWDLLVVVPDDVDDEQLAPMVAWRLRKESGLPADIVTCRAFEFRDNRDTPNTLIYEVARQGVLLC